jgi:nucleotide-binding universal stress UspA family protein
VLVGDLVVATGLYEFVLPVLLGNTLGGVVLVTVVNYFQTTEHRLASARFEGADRQLSVREWLLGGLAGRSYVPLIDTSELHGDGHEYRVVVPISNPRTESRLVELAAAVASRHEDAVVHVVHIVQMPDRTPRGYDLDQRDRIVENSKSLLADMPEVAASYGVDCETSTVVSHRSFQELFDVAERERADLLVMGWGEGRVWTSGRAERPLGELTNSLPADVLVFRDRGLDASRVLLPVADNEHAALNADVARALRDTAGSEVTLLRVAPGPGGREDAEAFLDEWAAKHDLTDATLAVDDSGDVEGAIADALTDHTMLLVGATEQGLLSRLLTDSLHYDVVTEFEGSVVFAEAATSRSIRRRLFGR